MTRDVTAWAGWVILIPEGTRRPVSGIGPILLASRSRAWARLGPLSVKSVLRLFFTQTVWRRRFSRRRSPNGVAWRFPDWTAVGFRFRVEPFAFLSHRSDAEAPRRRSSVRDRHVPSGASKPRLPDPFLGSFALHQPVTRRLLRTGSDASRVGELSSRGAKRHVRRR